MDTTLQKDARGFVDSIVGYLKSDGKSKASVPKVETLLNKVSTRAKKERQATVQTGLELSADEKKQLTTTLSSLLGHDIDLICSVNPDLIGGIRIQVGDWIVDMSLKSQLEQLKQILKQ